MHPVLGMHLGHCGHDAREVEARLYSAYAENRDSFTVHSVCTQCMHSAQSAYTLHTVNIQCVSEDMNDVGNVKARLCDGQRLARVHECFDVAARHELGQQVRDATLLLRSEEFHHKRATALDHRLR